MPKKMPEGKRERFLRKVTGDVSRHVRSEAKNRGAAYGRRAFIDCFEGQANTMWFLAEGSAFDARKNPELEMQRFGIESRARIGKAVRRFDALLAEWKETLPPEERRHALSEFIRHARKQKAGIKKAGRLKNPTETLLRKAKADLLVQLHDRAARERRLELLLGDHDAFLAQLEGAVSSQPSGKKKHVLQKRLLLAAEDMAEHLMDHYFYFSPAKTFQAPDFQMAQERAVKETVSVFMELWKRGKIAEEMRRDGMDKTEFKKKMRLSIMSALPELNAELGFLTHPSIRGEPKEGFEKSLPGDMIHSESYHIERRKAVLVTVLRAASALQEALKAL